MKMRHHRIHVQNKLLYGVFARYWQGRLDEMMTPSPEEQAASDAQHSAAIDKLFKDIDPGVFADTPPVPEVLRYQCVKVNGGEVVGTYYTREEALALVLKHARQKKAKLLVLDVVTGELEVFSEEEMA